MSLLHHLLDIVRHLDVHLAEMAKTYGAWVYGLLFLIFFCETGLVITPFLPGDSLLFAAGALAALAKISDKGSLNIWSLVILLIVAPILGNSVNYMVGHFFGPEL